MSVASGIDHPQRGRCGAFGVVRQHQRLGGIYGVACGQICSHLFVGQPLDLDALQPRIDCRQYFARLVADHDENGVGIWLFYQLKQLVGCVAVETLRHP